MTRLVMAHDRKKNPVPSIAYTINMSLPRLLFSPRAVAGFSLHRRRSYPERLDMRSRDVTRDLFGELEPLGELAPQVRELPGVLLALHQRELGERFLQRPARLVHPV